MRGSKAWTPALRFASRPVISGTTVARASQSRPAIPDKPAKFVAPLQNGVPDTHHLDNNWELETILTIGPYTPNRAVRDFGGAVVPPIFSSTSQAHASAEKMRESLAYEDLSTWAYARVGNPNVMMLQELVAMLETYQTGVTASTTVTASGMAAIRTVFDVFTRPGDEVLVPADMYGGTNHLCTDRLPERGVTARMVPGGPESLLNLSNWEDRINGKTRAIFIETPTNPGLACLPIKLLAELAHDYNIPLIVDSTIGTPALQRPLGLGADVVVQSMTKLMGGSGRALGGSITAKHDLPSSYFPEGVDELAWKNLALYLQAIQNRDDGPSLSAENAHNIMMDLKTLRLRVEMTSKVTQELAEMLNDDPRVKKVNYPGLPNNPYHQVAKEQMELADSDPSQFLTGSLLSLVLNHPNPVESARLFLDHLDELYNRATDLGRNNPVATIPEDSTHQQQGEELRAAAAINPGTIRLSQGLCSSKDTLRCVNYALDRAFTLSQLFVPRDFSATNADAETQDEASRLTPQT